MYGGAGGIVSRRRKYLPYVLLVLCIFLTPTLPQLDLTNRSHSVSKVQLPKVQLWTPADWFDTLRWWHSFVIQLQREEEHVLRIVRDYTTNASSGLNVLPRVEASDSSIAVDAYCSASGTGQASLTCNLNHTSNVLVLVFAMVNQTTTNGASITSMTVNGFAGFWTVQGIYSTSQVGGYIWYQFITVAANDAVVVNYSGATGDAESFVAVSFTGTRQSDGFSNDQVNTKQQSGSSASVVVKAGESGRNIINVVYLDSNASITPGASQTNIAQVNTTGASVEVSYDATSNAATLTSSWSGSTNYTQCAFALLPASNGAYSGSDSNMITDSITGSISNATSGTLPGSGQDDVNASSLCFVGVLIANNSLQTVSSVVAANYGTFIELKSVNTGTNLNLSLWYLLTSHEGYGTVTVTLSSSANAIIVMSCISNVQAAFEGTVTNTGNGGIASSGDVIGANTPGRRIVLLAGFATGTPPTGSQGWDEVNYTSGNLGIDLNYLDSSLTTNMQATDTSSNWAAIGTAVLPFPITIDATCSATGAEATTLTCNLNHSANTLIVAWVGDTGNDTVSSVTINGNAMHNTNGEQEGTSTTLYLWVYYVTAANNDPITATFTNHNENEALIAISYLGARSQPPYVNALAYGNSGAVSSITVIPPAGDANRSLTMATMIDHTDTFAPYEKPNNKDGSNDFDIAQVTGNSTALDVMGMNDSAERNLVQQWTTAANSDPASVAAAILPANQVVIDSITNTGIGNGGGHNSICSSNNASAASATCPLPSHDADVLVVASISIVDSSSQTVSSVTLKGSSFTQLTSVANGTSVNLSLWYIYDTASPAGGEQIKATFSSNAASDIRVAVFAGTQSQSPFFDVVNSGNLYQTNTGNSATATATPTSTYANDLMLLATGVGAATTPVGSQGVDITNGSGNGLGGDLNAWQQGGGTYTLESTFTPNNWATIALGILESSVVTTQTTVGTTVFSTTLTTSSASTTSSSQTPVRSVTTTVSASPSITNTLLTTTTTTGATAGTSTTTFTSPFSTIYSTTSSVASSTTSLTQTGTTTTGTVQSATTTSTGTTLSTTTAGGTVTVTQTDTFNVLLTQIYQALEQFEAFILQTLGFQVTATPVGQQVKQVIVTTTTPAQVTMTVSYAVVGGGSPTAPTFNYVLKGASKSLTLTITPQAVSVDVGSTWTVTPNPLGGSSSSQRWYSTQTLTGTASATTIVFSFQHQYYLTMKTSGPGTATPSNGWYKSGATVTITAKANSGHKFKSWTGTGTGSYTGAKNPTTITMNAAITETATFT